ncbi:hypothetical protein ACFOPS_04680 [Ralstonia solanacearum]|uniref:hypothetical protein n=1 Tax=Ralstonia solanacearum TaxID=305 RepID=UPI00360EF133
MKARPITVLGKGVRDRAESERRRAHRRSELHRERHLHALTNSAADCNTYRATSCATRRASTASRYSNSSQGGGGIFVHGWNHYMEIANNRVTANAGTLTGGITA